MKEESEEVIEARAEALLINHEDLLKNLVAVRKKHNLKQSEVAERMGVTQPAVAQFERYDANPTLDTVRRYAMAVGARLHTTVKDDTLNEPLYGDSLDPVTSGSTQKIRSSNPVETSIEWGPVAVTGGVIC